MKIFYIFKLNFDVKNQFFVTFFSSIDNLIISNSVIPIPIRYMSKITWTQNLGVSRWRNPKLATIGPESCLEYTLPCIVVASYGLRNRDTQDFLACIMSDADALFRSRIAALNFSMGLNIIAPYMDCATHK